MITETSAKSELLNASQEVIEDLLHLLSALEDRKLNAVPYPDSWTAGQLVRHVSKSIDGIARAMHAEAKPADRDPGARIAELRSTFLDFSTKMKSPEGIVPEAGPYAKDASSEELSTSFEQLQAGAMEADLNGLVSGLPLGPITKLEMLHFVLYHTQRHLHQMQQICDALLARS